VFSLKHLKSKKALVAVASLVALVAQTSSTTIDLTPIIGLLTALLPIIMTLIVVMMLFKIIGGLFEGLGRVFQFTKPKSIMRLAKLSPLSLVVLVAQTNTTAVDLGQTVGIATSLIYVLLPVILTFVVLGFVFKILGKLPDMIKF